MDAKAKNRPGRPPRPAALKRSEVLRLRLSPLELEALRVRAEVEGMSASAFIRSRCCVDPGPTARRSREVKTQRKAEAAAPGDFDALVVRYSRTMPRRSAEVLARRELVRG
jgi:hypothetical protein